MLIKRIIRTIKIYPTQFIAVFFMVMLGSFAFIGLNGSYDGINNHINNLYSEHNLADIWIKSASISESQLSKLSQLSDFDSIERNFSSESLLDGKRLRIKYTDENQINKFTKVNGEEFDRELDGIWIDSKFANNNGLKVGDEYRYRLGQEIISKKIVGTIESSEYIHIDNGDSFASDNTDNGYAVLSAKYLPLGVKFNQIIATSNSFSKKDLYSQLNTIFDDAAYSLTTREEKVSHEQINDRIKSTKTIATVFSILILLVSVLVTTVTIRRVFEKEHLEIGILRASGFSDSSIKRYYLSLFITIITSGMIAGSIFGLIILSPIYTDSAMLRYGFTDIIPVVDIVNLWILALILIGFVSLIWIMMRGEFLQMPAKSLTPNQPKVTSSKFSFLSRIVDKMPFVIAWNFRSIQRSKLRSVMTIAGIFGSLMLLMSGLAVLDTQNYYNKWSFEELADYETQLIVEGEASDIEKYVDQIDGETAMKGPAEAIIDNEYELMNFNVFSRPSLNKFERHSDGEMIELDNGKVYIGLRYAQKFGLKKGDEINWRVYGKSGEYKTKVEDILAMPGAQGLYLNSKTASEIGLKYKPNYVYTDKVKNGDASLKDKIVAQETSVRTMSENNKSMLSSTHFIISILIGISILLGGIILYNLGILSFAEQQYSYATLKVLGFRDWTLFMTIIAQNLFLAIMGIFLGIPAGINVAPLLIGQTEAYYAKSAVSLNSIVIAISLVIAIVVFVSWVSYRKVKKIDMTKALKAND